MTKTTPTTTTHTSRPRRPPSEESRRRPPQSFLNNPRLVEEEEVGGASQINLPRRVRKTEGTDRCLRRPLEGGWRLLSRMTESGGQTSAGTLGTIPGCGAGAVEEEVEGEDEEEGEEEEEARLLTEEVVADPGGEATRLRRRGLPLDHHRAGRGREARAKMEESSERREGRLPGRVRVRPGLGRPPRKISRAGLSKRETARGRGG
jgi:hypothetical protein